MAARKTFLDRAKPEPVEEPCRFLFSMQSIFALDTKADKIAEQANKFMQEQK